VHPCTHKQLFEEAWQLVDESYLGARVPFDRGAWAALRAAAAASPPRSRAAAYALLSSSLSTLGDPYTRFVLPKDFTALTRYDISGVGLNLGDDAAAPAGLRVLGVVLDSPAASAGVRQGDALLAINGVDAKGLNPFQAATAIQALPPGADVTLTVLPAAGGEPRTLPLRRPPPEAPPASPVTARMEPGGLGVIQIREMNGLAGRDVAAAISRLGAAGARGYVLDLRDCPGGLVAAGVEISRLFLDGNAESVIAFTEGRVQAAGGLAAADAAKAAATAAAAAASADGAAAAPVVAPPPAATALKPIPSGAGDAAPVAAPLVVLVNGRTASAAEIVAGALRDNCRAPLVGARTFGKGLIQSVYELSDGSGVVMTVGRYVRPSGVEIDQRGIAPDFATFPGLEAAQAALGACVRPSAPPPAPPPLPR
jgi:C-terminal processing protease CtpA/Prc